MNGLRDFWQSLRRPSGPEEETPLPDELLRPIALTALAGLERNLNIWAKWGAEQESGEPSKEMAILGQRVEGELRRFFGQEALRRIRSSAGESGSGTVILCGDRLFVAFLGRSAAMAVTRKLYSHLT